MTNKFKAIYSSLINLKDKYIKVYGFKLLTESYKMFLYKNVAITEVWDKIKAVNFHVVMSINSILVCLSLGAIYLLHRTEKITSLVSRVCSLLQETESF